MPEPTRLTQPQIDRLARSKMTFDEIAEEYGEDTAVNVGIVRDPDTVELDEEWFAKARPATKVHSHLVAEDIRRRSEREGLKTWEVNIPIDTDLLVHFLEGGPGWQERLNAALRVGVSASSHRPPLRPE